VIVTEVVYQPEGQAAIVADYIRLKMWLEKQGVDMKWETFEGESKFMKETAWQMEAEFERVDADVIRVEAFDLEIPEHTLIINGRRIPIPLTGPGQTQVFRFAL